MRLAPGIPFLHYRQNIIVNRPGNNPRYFLLLHPAKWIKINRLLAIRKIRLDPTKLFEI